MRRKSGPGYDPVEVIFNEFTSLQMLKGRNVEILGLKQSLRQAGDRFDIVHRLTIVAPEKIVSQFLTSNAWGKYWLGVKVLRRLIAVLELL